MKKFHTFINIVLVLLFLSAISSVFSSVAVADVDLTSVDSNGIRFLGTLDRAKNAISFKGIRYAQPPVGDLRWAPPQPFETAPERIWAYNYGNSCLQTLGLVPVVLGDEDCLNLNIWKPLKADKKKRPVMVFIHGGANILGSNNQSILGENLYDGASLANNGDVVVVSINYRLGALGFLASTGLSDNSETGTSGNYGLLDQIEALKWVRDNIEAFGGDPDNVTIFGESAGAANVFALMASPEAEGLFHKAIAQSGIIYDTPLEEAETQGDEFFRSLGCEPHDIDCARRISPRKITRALPLKRDGSKPIGPVIDKHVLKDDILKIFKKGKHNHVPLMIGTNEREAALLMPLFLEKSYFVNEARFREIITMELGEAAYPRIAKEYTPEKYGSYREALLALFGDSHFHLPAHLITDALEGSQDPDVFQYVFNHNSTLGRLTGLGATHAMELPLLFGTHKGIWDGKDHVVSNYLMEYWTNFAHTGNPNSRDSGLVHWPDSTEGALYLSHELEVREHIRHEECMELLKAAKPRKSKTSQKKKR